VSVLHVSHRVGGVVQREGTVDDRAHGAGLDVPVERLHVPSVQATEPPPTAFAADDHQRPTLAQRTSQ